MQNSEANTSSLPVLRDYQEQGVADIRGSFRKGRKRVLYVAPTGSGKTILYAYVAQNAAARGNRVCILEHRRELIRQAGKALDDQGLPYETIASGRRSVCRSQVAVASVQTLARRIEHYADAFDLIIVDEAHHAVAGTWRKVLDGNSKARILGVTATPERLDGTGLGDVFDDMVIGPGVRELMDRGYLAECRLFRAPEGGPDLTKVRRVMGDYHAGQLEEAMESPKLVGDAVEHYQREAHGRPAVAFCVSVHHAELMAEAFRNAGYAAASVDGKLDDKTRDERINGLGHGLDVLTSCELISEGLDVPGIAAAILCRPTKSLAMYRQQVGRALRPKPDGSAAIVLDHAGNSWEHSVPWIDIPWSLKSTKRKRRAGAEMPVRTCPECYAVQPAGRRTCENCGHEFEGDPRELETVDGTLEEVDRRFFDDRGRPIVERTRPSIDAAIKTCENWNDLETLRSSLGFKRGWSHNVARGLGWRPIVNGAGYTTRFAPPLSVVT